MQNQTRGRASTSLWDLLHKKLAAVGLDAGIRVDPISEPAYRRIAICGRTNVGKSSFVNALVDETVSIVQSKAATALPIFIRYGKDKTSYVKEAGKKKVVDTDLRGKQTFDAEIDEAWSGWIYELPRPYLRRDRYRLIDTPGLGSSADGRTFELLRNACEFRFVLFNKPDRGMLAPVALLHDWPLIAVRTQADPTDEYEYEAERYSVHRELEKRSPNVSVPFIYASVIPECTHVGSVYVPALAQRLDVVFEYRKLFLRCKTLLDVLEREEHELARAESAVTAEDAATIYDGWQKVKEQLDKIKRRRDKTISIEDAELLNDLVRIPVGRRVWERVKENYGSPPITTGQDPNGQYRTLQNWFLEINKRTTLERRQRSVADRNAVVRRDVKLMSILAAATLTCEFGDLHSVRVQLEPFRKLAGSEFAAWKAFAPWLWEN